MGYFFDRIEKILGGRAMSGLTVFATWSLGFFAFGAIVTAIGMQIEKRVAFGPLEYSFFGLLGELPTFIGMMGLIISIFSWLTSIL